MALKVKRFERLVSVCLDGSALADLQTANLETVRLAREVGHAKGDEAKVAELTALLDAASDRGRDASARAQAETVVFRLRALPGHVWDSLTEAHPAKEDEGISGIDAYRDALDAALSYTNPEHPEWRSVVEVRRHDESLEDFAPSDWEGFAADLAAEQVVDFHDAVLTLNAGNNSVPFLPPASKPSPPSDGK